MLLIPYLIIFHTFLLLALAKPANEAKEILLRKASSKDANSFGNQKISVVGTIGCSKADDTIKAKVVLKVSRNGKEMASSSYSSNKQSGSTLISMKRTEPKFLFLEIIPDSPENSKCNKTIKGKIRMREFKVASNGNKNDRIFELGDCDFSKGECSKFSNRSDPQTVSIVGSISCNNNKAVRATIVMKPKRYGEEVIKTQEFDSRSLTSSLLEAETKEPNTVFLRIIPDPSMGPACSKTVEAKLGLREFTEKNGKGVFDVGKCNLSTGKCTKFPFPQQ